MVEWKEGGFRELQAKLDKYVAANVGPFGFLVADQVVPCDCCSCLVLSFSLKSHLLVIVVHSFTCFADHIGRSRAGQWSPSGISARRSWWTSTRRCATSTWRWRHTRLFCAPICASRRIATSIGHSRWTSQLPDNTSTVVYYLLVLSVQVVSS